MPRRGSGDEMLPSPAGLSFDPEVQLILCAGAADTPELGRETEALVAEAGATLAMAPRSLIVLQQVST